MKARRGDSDFNALGYIAFALGTFAYGLAGITLVFFGSKWIKAAFPDAPWRLIVYGLGAIPLLGGVPFMWWLGRRLAFSRRFVRPRHRRRSERWSGDETRQETRVLDTMRFAQLPFLAWGLNLSLLPFQVLIYWGTWNPSWQLFFSAAALAYAALLAVKGWKPWRMPVYRAFGDGDSDRWKDDPVAIVVAKFFFSPRIRWTAVAITASAALTPWLITAISFLVGGRPIGANSKEGNWLPPFGQAILGYADGVRAGTIAMLWMRKQLRRNWSRIRPAVALMSQHAEPTV